MNAKQQPLQGGAHKGKVLPFTPPKGMEEERVLLKLYVTGATGRSLRAIENIKAVCEEHLKDHYELEVIDLYQAPDTALHQQIVAAPTLVKESPLPARRFIGDLSDTERVIAGLNIPPRS